MSVVLHVAARGVVDDLIVATLGWVCTGPDAIHSLRAWRDVPAPDGLVLTAEQHRLLRTFLAAER